MSINRLEKLAPLSGIAMVVFWSTFGFVLISSFDDFPTGEQIIEVFRKYPARIQVGAFLSGSWGAALMILFAGFLFSALRRDGDDSLGLPATAFGGGIVSAIAMAVGSGCLLLAINLTRSPGSISPEVAYSLYNLSMLMLTGVFATGLAVFVGATGLAGLRTRVFPVWFGWSSVFVAIGLITPFFYGFEVLALLWILVASIMFYQGGTSKIKFSDKQKLARETN